MMQGSKVSGDRASIEEAAETFKGARLAAGLTQDQVADALKITREKVIRLECGDLDELPPLIYVKGYLREFERILGLEPQSIEQPFVSAIEGQVRRGDTKAQPPVRNTMYTSPGQRVSIFLHANPARALTAILLVALAGIAFATWWVFAT